MDGFLFLVFIVALFFGILNAQLYKMLDRMGVEPRSSLPIMVRLLSVIASFSIIIWGFILLSWWIPIVSFISVSLVNGSFIASVNRNPEKAGEFYLLAPVFALANIGITAYAWFYFFSN